MNRPAVFTSLEESDGYAKRLLELGLIRPESRKRDESMIDTSYDITAQRDTSEMVRNWDIVREILLKVEALPSMDSQFTSDEVTGVPPEEAAYLMHMLIDAGLMMGGYRTAVGAPWSYANRLTWQGHDFLDTIRTQTVWEKIKATAISEARPLSIEAIKVVAKLLLGS